jgi:hypothetical protein
MEPVVVVVKEIKNGKIMLTEDELKTIVRRAYNDGYWEGRKNNWYGGITYRNTTTTPYPYTTNITSSDPDKYANITITWDDSKRNSISGQLNIFNEMIGDFMND